MSTIQEQRRIGSSVSPLGNARQLDTTGLFGGVGGLERGLSQAGHLASSFCEIDPEAATILKARFPDATVVRDIRQTEEVLAAISPRSNLLTAGFPCTDLSQAGRVQGFAGGRSSLVRDALKLIEARPFPHVLLENVPNWRILHRGEYLREVAQALENLGYRWAYRTVDALAFGAPQRRLRIFFYATLEGDPRDVLFQGQHALPDTSFELDDRAHGFYWTEGTRGLGWGEDCVPTLKGGSTVGVPSPPAILLPNLNVPAARTTTGEYRLITPDIRDAERLQGLPVGWTASEGDTLDGTPFRQRRRWVLVGNAVNVRTAAWLGQRLAQPTTFDGETGRELGPDDAWPAAAWFDGRKRFGSEIGAWPVAAPRENLAEFLSFPGAPLSTRATSGFLGRFLAGKLRQKPGFAALLQSHIDQLSASPDHGLKQAA